jgi:HEPN domain-containing protein
MSEKSKTRAERLDGKKRTSRNVRGEIERIQKANVKRTDRIAELRNQIKTENAKIKELEKLYETLHKEEIQGKVADVWFKEQKLTDEQAMKFLEMGKKIGDKIDNLDVDSAVKLLMAKVE